MNNVKKMICASAMAAITVFQSIPVIAATGEHDFNIAYNTVDGDKVYYISKYKGTSENVTIPKTIKGEDIEWLGRYSFYNNDYIKNVKINSNIKKIYREAFCGCESLENVELSNELTYIDDEAFRYCSNLKTITIPESVEYIGSDVFKDCPNVTVYGYKGSEGEKNFQDSSLVFRYVEDDTAVSGAQFKQINGNWYMILPNGSKVTGWYKDNGKFYYFDKSTGIMQSGWLNDNGKWFYLDGYGAMVTGWLKYGKAWYYLRPNGVMAFDTKIDGYYLKSDGAWDKR